MRRTETQDRTATETASPSTTTEARTDHLHDPLASQGLHDDLGGAIQMQEEEEEEMQMKEDDGAQETRGVSFSNSGGEPIADGVRGKMESSFGADFSDVKIHRDSAAADLGAKAFTQGRHIHVKSGVDTASPSGQALLGHELSHVQQQRAGRVSVQGKGLPINRNPGLEAEADRDGAMAAAGKRVR